MNQQLMLYSSKSNKKQEPNLIISVPGYETHASRPQQQFLNIYRLYDNQTPLICTILR